MIPKATRRKIPNPTPIKTKDKDKDKDKSKPEESVKVTIDFDGISQRILALPVPAKDYVGLDAGKTCEVFLGENPPGSDGGDEDGGGPGQESTSRNSN